MALIRRQKLRISHVGVKFGKTIRHGEFPTWQIRVKLGTEGQIVLTRSNEGIPPALTGFLKVLQETMTATKRFAPEMNIADVSASIALLGTATSRLSKL